MRAAVLSALAALGLAALGFAASAGAQTLPPADIAAIETVVADAMTAQNLPGVAIGVWIPGRGTHLIAMGAADLATGASRGIGDPFRIGSVTKTMIATVVLQLAEEGRLALDTLIAAWFPDFPNARMITVDDLLRMRSGIFETWTETALADYYDNPQYPPSMDEMIARSAAAPGAFTAPDTETIYVNLNYLLLDRIISAVTGAPTREAVTARVFEPLGMTASDLPIGTELPGPLRGYGWNAATAAFEDKTELDVAPVGGAGAAISTLADLATFTRALCTGNLLSADAQTRRMATEPFAGGAGVWRAMARASRRWGRSAGTTALSSAFRPRPGICRARTP